MIYVMYMWLNTPTPTDFVNIIIYIHVAYMYFALVIITMTTDGVAAWFARAELYGKVHIYTGRIQRPWC